MATQVTIDELQDWLSEQPENTVETPYELEVTGLTVDNYRRINRTSLLTNKYIDLRPTVLPSGISLGNLFAENDNLVYAPVIPEGLTNASNMFTNCRNLKEAYFPKGIAQFSYTFYQCISLKKANITSSNNRYRNFAHMFEGCSSLEVVEVNELVQESITDYVNMFSGCNNIVLFKSDRPYELKQWLNTIYNESTDNFPKDPDTCAYNLLMTPAEIPITLLSNELSALSENTVGTPYDIKITGLTNLNLSSIKTSLLNNSTKYVNLSQTVLPKSITDMGNFYSGCTSLVVAPNIPESVKNLGATFWGCTNLLSSPVIPNSVTDMTGAFHNCTSLSVSPNIPNSVVSLESTFWGCTGLVAVLNIPNSVTNMLCAFYECLNLTSVPFISESVENMEASFYRCSSLVTIPNIPNSVVNLEDAFYNCTSLTTINEFNVAQEILTTKASGCFYNCTSLTTIGVKDEISESSNWNIFSLKVGSNNISGKVYDKEGNSSSITQTNITKTSVKMPIYTDELWFPASNLTDSKVESIIQDMIAYKYGVFNRQVIPPNERSFVLWANDTDNLITNLTALSPVDRVESGNMSPVTSNAVANWTPNWVKGSTMRPTTANLYPKSNNGSLTHFLATSTMTTEKPARDGHIIHMSWDNNGGYGAQLFIPNSGTNTIPQWRCEKGGEWTAWKNFITEDNIASQSVAISKSLNGVVTCSTAGATVAKTVALEGFVLTKYAELVIDLQNANTVATPTLSVNGTTAKTIRINGSAVTASNLSAGIYKAYYDGTYWNFTTYQAYNAYSAYSASQATQANYTRGNAYCTTAGGTVDKVADMRGYVLQSGATFPITFTNANSSASALTLSVNGTTAKPIYINGSVSSASNYTLPAGTYLCRYNGTNYYIDKSYAVPNARSANSATTATTANRIRTSAPSSPVNGDIWLE